MSIADCAMRLYYLFSILAGLILVAACVGAGIALVGSLFLTPGTEWQQETFFELWEKITATLTILGGFMILKAFIDFFSREILNTQSSYFLHL
ncbi:MAG: hypothetical protein WCV80_00190 [Candidatus Paceibacterota bacterium]|jgi:hypothetical protein